MLADDIRYLLCMMFADYIVIHDACRLYTMPAIHDACRLYTMPADYTLRKWIFTLWQRYTARYSGVVLHALQVISCKIKFLPL